MEEKIIKRDFINFTLEERVKLENEIRSNLRYTWQKLTSFIIYYNPTITEIEQQLLETFLQFIPLTFPKRELIRSKLSEVFYQNFQVLLSNKNLTNPKIEEYFINISIVKFRGILL